MCNFENYYLMQTIIFCLVSAFIVFGIGLVIMFVEKGKVTSLAMEFESREYMLQQLDLTISTRDNMHISDRNSWDYSPKETLLALRFILPAGLTDGTRSNFERLSQNMFVVGYSAHLRYLHSLLFNCFLYTAIFSSVYRGL